MIQKHTAPRQYCFGVLTQPPADETRTADLRGLQIADVLQMQVDAVAAVLSRISVPTLHQRDVDNMDPADFVACAMEVASFLVPKSVTAQLPA